jgi:hypothetical protein
MSLGAARLSTVPGGSSAERCAGQHHRWSAPADRADDLARVDPLQVRRGRPEVGVLAKEVSNEHGVGGARDQASGGVPESVQADGP